MTGGPRHPCQFAEVTFHEFVAEARRELGRAGISPATAALDADLLARDVLRWDRARWLLHRDETADESFQRQYTEVIARRATREPVAYIRGVQEFWGRDFEVNSSVLIPRPETELTIEVALAHLTGRPASTVVDVGTGCGCIAITLALEHPGANIFATDVSEQALPIARANATRLGARVQLLQGPYLATAPRPIDLIVTNPPYVAERDRPALAPEVKDYEPAIALFGGDDGLREVRAMLDQARAGLARDGRLVMEIGYGQADRVEQEVANFPELILEEIRGDLQGIRRVVVARRADTSTPAM
jgi:release factor glutamine methyltransferase